MSMKMDAFDGLEKSYINMEKSLMENAPRCHMTKMSIQDGEDETWWECEHCGHTKPLWQRQGER